MHQHEQEVDQVVAAIQAQRPVHYLLQVERCYFEDDPKPCYDCNLEFAPESIRELQGTPIELTCLMCFYQPMDLTAIEAERLHRFAPPPTWRSWWARPWENPTLPTCMLKVRIKLGDVVRIHGGLRDRGDAEAGRQRV